MADSVVKLKVDSREYDAKIKRAADGIRAFGENCKKAGQGVDKADKETLDYVRSLGRMETVSNTAKGQIGEMTKAFTDLSVQYRHLTDQEKNSPFGKALAQSLDQLKGRIADSKKELADITSSLGSSTGSSAGGMSAFGDLKGLGGVIEGVAGKFGMSTSLFTAAGASIAGVGLAAKLAGDNIATALNFEKSVSQLSSLTGKTGEDLEQLKEYAIELGGTTTLSASQVADAFKMIGSQQPQLLESGEALRDVTKAAITLSEAAGIELATAAQTLSTSINQFGGDSSNAERFINVLAAASQKGAGDISFLGEAISKSGTLANAIGVSYEELVANLEQLAQAGIDASTSGTALRSIIASLESQSNNDYKPSVVGLTEAFHNLNEANLTTVEYADLAGKQFFSQAMILAENADKARLLTEEITGTNTAEEQARINTDNLDGSIKNLSSAWEALNLHLNSSNGLLKSVVDWLKDCVVWADKALQSLQNYINYNPSPRGLDEVGPNVDDNGNYIRKPVDGNWAHFNAETGEYEKGYGPKASAPPTPPPRPTRPAGGGGGGRGGGRTGGRGGGRTGGGAANTPPPEGSIAAQEAKVQALTKAWREATDEAGRAGYAGMLEEAKQVLDQMQGKTKEVIPEGSLKDLNNQLHELQKQRELLTDPIEVDIIDTDIERVKDQIDELNGKLKEVPKTEPISLEAKIRTDISDDKINADMQALTNLLRVKLENELDNIEIPSEYLQHAIFGEGIPDSYWQGLVDQINEQLKTLGIDPIELNVKTGEITTAAKEAKEGWQDAARAVQAVGGALQQLEDPSAKIAGIVGQAIANIALGFAQATASDSKLGVFGWIAAIAGGLGTMVSTISAIKSATAGSYAEGGIIPGHDYNDGMIAAVSSGELILNRAQQGNLASQLTNSGIEGLQLEAIIDGEDIRIAVRNGNRRRGRGEYVTTKSR